MTDSGALISASTLHYATKYKQTLDTLFFVHILTTLFKAQSKIEDNQEKQKMEKERQKHKCFFVKLRLN